MERDHARGVTYGNVVSNRLTSFLQGAHQASVSIANKIQKFVMNVLMDRFEFFLFNPHLTVNTFRWYEKKKSTCPGP